MELETITLIKTLMNLRGLSQADLAKKANVSKASLSKYLSRESDLRAEALLRISSVLGVSFNLNIKFEINKFLGQAEAHSIGDDIQFLLSQATPIDRRTIADSLVAKFKNGKDLETRTRVLRIKKYRDSIKTMRRN